MEEVLATPELLAGPEGRRLEELLDRPPIAVAAEALDSLAEADSPRGILAVASLPRGGVDRLPAEAGGLYLFAEGIQDPGNVGAIARAAEAAGATGLALSPGSAHPNHPRALRASAGSLLRLPVAVDARPDRLDERLAGLAPRWLALVPSGGEPLYEETFAGTTVIALGAEGPGLSSGLAGRAERRLTIPLAAPVESLNVAVAAALALFEARRRRKATPSPPPPPG